MTAPTRAGGSAFWLATAGVVWAAGFAAWALNQPVVVADDDAGSIRVVIVAAVLMAGGVWLALHAACRRDLWWARTLGLLGGWLLVGFGLISSFGPLVLPAAVALVWAGALTPVAGR